MKKYLFLLLALPLFIACSSDDDDKETWEQRRETEQNEVYNKLTNNIIGSWKEYMFLNYRGNWIYSEEDTYRFISKFTFNQDNTVTIKTVSEDETYTYTIEKNPKFVQEANQVCILIRLSKDKATADSYYSAWIDEDGYLRLDKVSSLLTEIVGWKTPEYAIKFIKD